MHTIVHAITSVSTHQFIRHVEQDVHGGDAVGAVFPLAVHHYARLLLEPRQIVVVLSVVERVAGRGRGGLGRRVGVQFVAVVADADFKLDGCVHGMDHSRGEEGTVEFVLAPSKETLGMRKRVMFNEHYKPIHLSPFLPLSISLSLSFISSPLSLSLSLSLSLPVSIHLFHTLSISPSLPPSISVSVCGSQKSTVPTRIFFFETSLIGSCLSVG